MRGVEGKTGQRRLGFSYGLLALAILTYLGVWAYSSYAAEWRAKAQVPQIDPILKIIKGLRHQINSLEASAETLRDAKLLREVHEWEKNVSNTDPKINWEGRAIAREITSGLAVKETKERLESFLESKKVASLHLGDHRTGTLREVEARSLTEYLARAIESRAQRDYRHTIKLAAREHHGRLVSDFEKAQVYYEAARELASEAKERAPKFTDKERINLEIYAELQNNQKRREEYLEMARGDSQSQEREISASHSR